MNENSPIFEILHGCCCSEPTAQRILYARYFSFGLNLCLRYAQDEDEAKYMLNEAFFKVFKSIKQYRNDGSFEGWLRRVFVTTAIDILRKKKRLKPTENLDDLQIMDTEDSAVEEMQYEDALELVQQLTPMYRAVFNLYVIEGYSHFEIAKELNISVGTSKSNLSRAKSKLRVLFGEEYPEY